MQLVKRTQKEWTCFKCQKVIAAGTSMFRETFSRWVEPNTYCLQCSKPMVEKQIQKMKEQINDKDMPSILVEDSKSVLEYAEKCLIVIDAKS